MMQQKASIFRSYWIAGYEGADHINGKQIPQSMNDANHHQQKVDADYALLKQFNIQTVRESIGWRLTEHHHQFNWQALEKKAEAAQKHDIQVIWTLMHYGWPTDIDPLGPEFVGRFTQFCEAVAKKLKPYHDEAPFYQPLNEISFLSWAMAFSGLMYPFQGNLGHRSYELKRQLVLAALRGSEAIWSVDPRARIVHTDPIIHIIPPLGAEFHQVEEVHRHNEHSFQAWDMLCGDMEPAFGGSPQHLDIIGMNYYHNNQWVDGNYETLYWHLKDPRRLPFNELAARVWKRYERPMFIAETSHVGVGRGDWLDDIASEVLKCEQRGVPIDGICLYPIIDRPDWENPDHWHNSGLWDVTHVNSHAHVSIQPTQITLPNIPLADLQPTPMNHPTHADDVQPEQYQRVIHQPYAERLHHWQQYLPNALPRFMSESNADLISNNPK